MQDLKSFKKYSWLISGIFALLVFISGLTANDISFLPAKYQSVAVGIIGASALLVKLFPENYRVYVAETLVKQEFSNSEDIPKNALQYYDGVDEDGT